MLKLDDFFRPDVNVGKFPKSGGNTVHGPVVTDYGFHNRPGTHHFCSSAGMKDDPPPVVRNFVNVFNRESLAVDQQRIHKTNDSREIMKGKDAPLQHLEMLEGRRHEPSSIWRCWRAGGMNRLASGDAGGQEA